MAKKAKTADELIEAAEHVCYEIWMLHHMGRSLAYGLTGKGPIHNAFLESFAVHVRNLIGFLFESRRNSKADAILAQDYILYSGKDWGKICPTKTAQLESAEIRAHKQIAHLTYTRKKKEEWDFIGVVQDLHQTLTIFINNIDIKLLGVHFNPIKHYFHMK